VVTRRGRGGRCRFTAKLWACSALGVRTGRPAGAIGGKGLVVAGCGGDWSTAPSTTCCPNRAASPGARSTISSRSPTRMHPGGAQVGGDGRRAGVQGLLAHLVHPRPGTSRTRQRPRSCLRPYTVTAVITTRASDMAHLQDQQRLLTMSRDSLLTLSWNQTPCGARFPDRHPFRRLLR
jgi:hypothetical protein